MNKALLIRNGALDKVNVKYILFLCFISSCLLLSYTKIGVDEQRCLLVKKIKAITQFSMAAESQVACELTITDKQEYQHLSARC